MGKTICEIKMELKAKGIKGITGLNKGQLEALLQSDGNAPAKPKKRSEESAPPKPKKDKPFTPAATKGETPKVAEKKITKKEKIMKPLMLTYKEPSEQKKAKPPPKIKRPKQTESERIMMLNTKRQGTECQKLMKKAGLKTEADLKRYIITNHPDKVKNYDPNSKASILYRELSNCSSVFKNLRGYLSDGYIKGFKGL